MKLSRTLTNLEEGVKGGVMGEVNLILREERLHRKHIQGVRSDLNPLHHLQKNLVVLLI